MTAKTRLWALATIGLMTMAIPAAALGSWPGADGGDQAGAAGSAPECEAECDGDVPGNGDCAFSSADATAVTDDAIALADTDLCIGNSDTFEEKGFWAVASVCLSAFFEDVSDATGIDVVVDLFVSQHGIDIDGWVEIDDERTDLEEDTPLGDLDDETWDVLGDVDESLHDSDVDSHDLVPVGGEDLPTADVDALADLRDESG